MSSSGHLVLGVSNTSINSEFTVSYKKKV